MKRRWFNGWLLPLMPRALAAADGFFSVEIIPTLSVLPEVLLLKKKKKKKKKKKMKVQTTRLWSNNGKDIKEAWHPSKSYLRFVVGKVVQQWIMHLNVWVVFLFTSGIQTHQHPHCPTWLKKGIDKNDTRVARKSQHKNKQNKTQQSNTKTKHNIKQTKQSKTDNGKKRETRLRSCRISFIF